MRYVKQIIRIFVPFIIILGIYIGHIDWFESGHRHQKNRSTMRFVERFLLPVTHF